MTKNTDRIWVYRDKRDGQWWADLSYTDSRHTTAARLEFGSQERLPFGLGADWRVVRDYVAGRYSGDEINVDYLSRAS
jgi:hypothetical protein